MVDREARDKTIRLVRDFASGRITNHEFEDNLPEDSKDEAIAGVGEAVWKFYDDLSEHKLDGDRALSKEDKKFFARMILFLKNDLEYEWDLSWRGFLDIIFLFSTFVMWATLAANQTVFSVLIVLPYIFHFLFDATKVGKRIFCIYMKLLGPVVIVGCLIVPSYWTRSSALFVLVYYGLLRLISLCSTNFNHLWPFCRKEQLEAVNQKPIYFTGNQG